jgi:phthiocerol/phenolphthiocerol synthesis type-I polyketide synthase E
LSAQGQEVSLLALFDTTDWSKIPRVNFWNTSYMACEKFWFHVKNFFKLDSKGRSDFLSEKIQAIRNRIPVWKGTLYSKLGGSANGTASESIVLAKIWKTNDRACFDYKPKPYSGKITNFRPMKQYSLFDRPGAKWDALAQGGHEVIVLPVYPAGMLNEPFVQHLASAIRRSIDAALR